MDACTMLPKCFIQNSKLIYKLKPLGLIVGDLNLLILIFQLNLITKNCQIFHILEQ